MTDDNLSFLLDDDEGTLEPKEFYKILLIDDDESVHFITKSALQNKTFDGKGLDILSAYSAKEAKAFLNEHNDISLAIVDVVMETPTAGLDLINYIRNDLVNNLIRLVLRTGQADQVPEEEIINKYDINDYKEKTELTVEKLYTLVRTSIKQYEQIKELQDSRDAIYKKMTTNILTNLPNRMKLNEELDSDGKKSIVMVNINNFSKVNEDFGFEVGDRLLIEFADFLLEKYSKSMQIFHIQGDIFSLMCLDVKSHKIEDNLQDIKDTISEHNFNVNGRKVSFTVSMGAALRERGNLIQKAEFAMYKAKKSEAESIEIYSDI